MKRTLGRSSFRGGSARRIASVSHLGALLTWLCLSASSARGLEIELSYFGGFEYRPDAIAAMERAASNWERELTDPVTVRIEVREVSLFDLGFATGATFREAAITDYSALRSALATDAKSTSDILAVANLPAAAPLAFRTLTPQGEPVVNSGNDAINNYVDMFRSQAKALGLPIEGDPLARDAEVQWNDFFLDNGFDFDRSDGVDGMDFESIAMHELGHALGFESGADLVDESSLPNGPSAPEDLSEFAIVRVLDLFRYSAASLPLPDLEPGTEAYFSIDGGATSLATFSTGQYNGDGWQAGHWEGESGQGIMDANLPDNVIQNLTALDLQAMDVIGWDLQAPGDFNLDGIVDAADYVTWRDGLGTAYSQTDYDAWKSHFGQTDGSGTGGRANATAPEPAVLTTLIMGTLAMWVRRRNLAVP
jgi:hypothetical protein